MLALTVAGIAVEIEVATGAGTARLLVVTGAAKMGGSIARVGWRKVRLKERRRSMYSRRP